ncbi:MAG: hypothetical protein AB7O45_09510 [Alphaproteobacteria bacterium]
MTVHLVSADYLAAGNAHHRRPVMVIEVAGAMPAAERLATIAKASGEFEMRQRLDRDDVETPATVLADLALALLRHASEPVSFRRSLDGAREGGGRAVFACRVEAVARRALRTAAAMLGSADDAAAAIGRFVAWAEPVQLHPDDVFMAEAVEGRGIAWRLSSSGKREMVIGEGARSRRTLANLIDRTSFLGVSVCHSKRLTNLALLRAGLPGTVQRSVRSAEGAVAAARAIGFPVVVKPVAASKGVGVACLLTTEDEVRRAYAEASAYGGALVEGHLVGDDHRLLVIDGRFVRCTRRMRAKVVGDGLRSIAALVEAENARPERRPAPDSRFMPIRLDAEVDRVIALAGHDRASVPAAGETVILRAAANWSQGGTAALVTDRVHPDNIRLAEHVARHLGIDIAGVDVITDDISRAFHESGARINEVQRQPAIGAQRRALGPGAPRLHETLFDTLFPEGSEHRVPIWAIAGDAAPAVIAAMARSLEEAGHIVGTAARNGLAVEGRWLSTGDHRGAAGFASLLDDPTVTAILVEIDLAEVARRGLGHERLDVLVLTDPDGQRTGPAILAPLTARGVVCVRSGRPVPRGFESLPVVAVPVDAQSLADAAIALGGGAGIAAGP